MSASLLSRPNVLRRVTDVAELIDATGIDSVTTDGRLVAIRFATRNGLVIVKAPLKAFNDTARAPLDSNNRPFMLARDIQAQLEEDAREITVTKSGPDAKVFPKRNGAGNFLPKPVLDRLREIFALRQVGKDKRSYTAIAREVGCSNTSVGLYFHRWEKETRPPLRKPNGKLL